MFLLSLVVVIVASCLFVASCLLSFGVCCCLLVVLDLYLRWLSVIFYRLCLFLFVVGLLLCLLSFCVVVRCL